jgi:rhamnosyltransferase
MGNIRKDDEVAAVIVFYNPPDNVLNNIASFAPFVSRIYVFDNSEIKKNNLYLNLKEIYGDKLLLHFNNCNSGIGTALNQAVCWALNDGFRWLLTMDQDSKFSDSTYFDTFMRYTNKIDVAIFSPLHDQDAVIDPKKPDELVYEDLVMTSGNLLNLELSKAIGRFNEKLFIDEVDHEYCLRTRLKNYRIVRFINIRLLHILGKPSSIIRKGEEAIMIEHAAFRVYYITRNNLYLWKKYCLYFPRLICKRILNLVVMYRNIIFYQQDRKEKLYFGLKGFVHFIIGRYGKL